MVKYPKVHYYPDGSIRAHPPGGVHIEPKDLHHHPDRVRPTDGCWCCGKQGHRSNQCYHNPESTNYRPSHCPNDVRGKPNRRGRAKHRQGNIPGIDFPYSWPDQPQDNPKPKPKTRSKTRPRSRPKQKLPKVFTCSETDVYHCSHVQDSCLDPNGLNICRYPMECPFLTKGDRSNQPFCQPVQPVDDPICDLPTQEELRSAALGDIHSNYDSNVALFTTVDEQFINALLLAPHKAKAVMNERESFTIVWDSGASRCITNDLQDFVSPPTPKRIHLGGLATGLHSEAEGMVAWTVPTVTGGLRTLRLPALLANSPVKLASTGVINDVYPEETIVLDSQGATLSGLKGDPTREPVKAWKNPLNNIPECQAYRMSGLEMAAAKLHHITTTVDPRNINLSEPEKELLRWHQRLGHIDQQKVQFLFRSGVLATSLAKRSLQQRASKLQTKPRCAACQFGKQTARGNKHRAKNSHTITDATPVLKEGNLFPGQMISVDHFVCSTKGVTLSSRGGSGAEGYCGGCIMVDHASGHVHVGFQKHLNTHETLAAIQVFERLALDNGVVPTSYMSDSGTAFTSKEFREHLSTYKQINKFAGTGAHHHNAVAERSIRTIMSIARTMMMHAAIHWPDMADATLWPLAVEYACFVFNRVPNPHTGLSPLDVFTGTRQPQRRLHDCHVWGCPAYLLDKRIADGKKLPQFQPKSERTIFVGISDKHFANIPRVLNPRTRSITTPYHAVFDDWFATVSANVDELPDFQTPEWTQLFGDSIYQFIEDETWTQEAPVDAQQQQMFERRERVADSLDLKYNSPNQPHDVDNHELSLDSDDVVPPLIPRPRSGSQRESARPAVTGWRRETRQTPIQTPTAQPPIPDYSAELTPTWEPPTAPSLPGTPVPGVEFNDPTPAPSTRPTHKVPGLSTPGEVIHTKRVRNRPKYLVEGNYTVQGNNITVGGNTYHFSPEVFYYLLDEPFPEFYKASQSDPDTMTLQQALADTENYGKWIEALEKEIRALEEHGVWEEVPVSDARGDIVPSHFVMKVKRKPDGSLDKFKARLVIAGNRMQSYGFETFAPVCAWSTVRILLVLALTWGWHTCTCDYSNAFIHSKLPDSSPVWMRLPKGYRSAKPGRTCLKLKKSLYGSNFAPFLWVKTCGKALENYGLKPSKHDPCLYTKPGVMVACYVDDLLMAFKDPNEKKVFLQSMKDQGFTLTMDDNLGSFLGIKFEHLEDGTINLTQPALIDKIIEATNMQDCNPSPTPAAPNQPLGKDPDGEPMTDSWNYKSVCGMLLYLSTNSRPDITYAVSQVCRFSHDPKQSHAAGVKRIVRYLAGTKNMGTYFKPDGTLSLDSMSDSDFAGLYNVDPVEDPSSSKSRMGYIIKLSGCPLIWKSALITSVCLATAESEYYSLSHCLRALLPIRRLLEELAERLELDPELRSTISSRAFGDNSACMTIARDHRLTSRTRYYHVFAHHFWEAVDEGVVVPTNIATTLMDADYFTKGMPREGFEKNRKRVQGW